MSQMALSNSEAIDYVVGTLDSSKTNFTEIEDARYHHNASYKDAPLVCKHGILPLIDLNKMNIRHDSLEALNRMDDSESHINGNSSVSLSVMGLDDLYNGEDEYDPTNPLYVDFIVSSSVPAYRNSSHYGNEFICSSVSVEDIRSLDFRILKYIESQRQKGVPVEVLVNMYSSLLQAARIIKEKRLNMLMREMSSYPFGIDIDKFSSGEEIVLKKK